MLLNCGVGEDPLSPLDCKEIQPVHPKGNQSWIFIGRTDAKDETPILWPPDANNRIIEKDPDAGKDRTEGEGSDRGWDGWMTSPTQWIWVWVNSRSWWLLGRPGVLQSMGSLRVRHDWTTELVFFFFFFSIFSASLRVIKGNFPLFYISCYRNYTFYYFLPVIILELLIWIGNWKF